MELRKIIPSEPMITEEGSKKSSELIVQLFLLEYELLQLLEQNNFTPSIIEVNDVIPQEALTTLIIDTKLTEKIIKVKAEINKVQSMLKSTTPLNLDDITDVRSQLTKRSNVMLKIACVKKNAFLRDVAIKTGAQHDFFLMESMKHLLSSYHEPSRLSAIEEFDQLNYDKAVFLLETSCHIISISEVVKIAQEIGPKMLIPVFDYLNRQTTNGISYLMVKTYLEHHVKRYMADHTINFLLDRNIPHVPEVCMSVLGFTPLEFYASVGNKHEIANIQLRMNLHDGGADEVNASKALRHACYYGRKEVVEMLIKAGVDVNSILFLPGSILFTAVKRKQVEVIELLLAASNIEIGLKPFINKPNIYDCAMNSSAEIKKLFESKKKEIDEEINVFIGMIIKKITILLEQAPKLLAGIGCNEKAKTLQQALNNALITKQSCFSVYEFLHIKIQNEPSIFEALEKIRLWSKPENEDLLKDIKVPASRMRPH